MAAEVAAEVAGAQAPLSPHPCPSSATIRISLEVEMGLVVVVVAVAAVVGAAVEEGHSSFILKAP